MGPNPRARQTGWRLRRPGDESQGLLDRLFGGQLAPLVAHFAREKAVSPEDLARLKRPVAELDAEEED